MTDLQVFGLVLIALAVGLVAGHALGYARAKDVERRRRDPERVMTSGPRYRRTMPTYDVTAPNGLYLHTPSLDSAESFAAQHGGDVSRSE